MGPLDLLEGTQVAQRGAVGGDDQVGAGDERRHLSHVGALGAVVHDHAQPGHEAARLGRPVPDHRGRGDHAGPAPSRQLRPGVRVGGGLGRAGRLGRAGPFPQVGQHDGGLAEAHVERQAAAETGSLEEAQPRHRLGLVAAQLADEALGAHDEVGLELGGTAEQVGRPALAGEGDPTGQRRALQAEDVAQHVRAAEPGLVGPFRQRGGRCGQVGPVELHPPTPGLHEGAGLAGQLGDLLRAQLDVVEHRRPADVGELAGTDHRALGVLRGEAEGRRRPAAGQGGDPDVEARRHEQVAGDRHEPPRLVLAQEDLAPAAPAGAQQLREEPLEAGELRPDVGPALRRGGDEHALDRAEPPAVARGQHRQVPGTAVVGRVELDDERDVRGALDRPRPLLEPAAQLARGPQRGLEDAAIEAGEDRLGDVRVRAQLRWGCGHLDPLGGVDAEGVHGVADHRFGDRPGVTATVQQSDRAGHRPGQGRQRTGIEQGRRPVDLEGRPAAAGRGRLLALRRPRPAGWRRRHGRGGGAAAGPCDPAPRALPPPRWRGRARSRSARWRRGRPRARIGCGCAGRSLVGEDLAVVLDEVVERGVERRVGLVVGGRRP